MIEDALIEISFFVWGWLVGWLVGSKIKERDE